VKYLNPCESYHIILVISQICYLFPLEYSEYAMQSIEFFEIKLLCKNNEMKKFHKFPFVFFHT